MKKYMIAALVIVLMVISSCSGCSESGRRAQQKSLERKIIFHTDQLSLEAPTYYIVTKIYKENDIISLEIVTYIAETSTPKSGLAYIKFYHKANAFMVGDTLRLKK